MPRAGAARILALSLALCLLAAAAHAQERGITGTASANTAGEVRVALVIGNSAYPNGPLRNPVNDAEDMAAALRACGFEVIKQTDASLEQFDKAIQDFGNRIRSANVALFYYAGHAIQAQGENYLLPVGVTVDAENELKYRSINAGLVLAKMSNAGTAVNIVILDACRNNPYARSWRSDAKGLAVMDAAQGTLVAYSTAPGDVAADGAGRNGVYTERLLEHLGTPGVPVELMFKAVRTDVLRDTDRRQVPWENSSLVGDFFFAGKPGPSVPATATVAAVPPTTAPPPPTPPSMLGHLQVAVNAPDSQVSVNGRRVGTASPDKALNLENLLTGKARVLVEAEGYGPVTQEVAIKRNEWTQIAVELPRIVVADVHQVAPRPSGGEPRRGETRTFAGIEMVWIPAGSFQMGSRLSAEEVARKYGGKAEWYEDEHPRHEVRLTEGFWMGKYEVTNAQYRRYEASHSSGDYEGHGLNGGDQPVVKVSWNDATGFCEWLSKQGEGSFRLPTEAEWEYACRAGTTASRYWGNDDASMGRYANVADRTAKSEWKTWTRTIAETTDGYKVAAPVGRFAPNAWGLYDMIGNVWEWCSDWYDGDHYKQLSKADPQGPSSGSLRVLRGGSWLHVPWRCRSDSRTGTIPAFTDFSLGFRLVRSSAGR